MKIVTVVGCRPQFIKAAVMSRSFKEQGIDEVIIHTGQHYDQNMSKIFFDQLEIQEPKYNLGVNNCRPGAMISRMLEEIELILMKEKPDLLLVYGDTNSTLAGALAAKKLHIKIIHIEAGVRDHDMNLPEEVNRVIVDRISDLLFCPSSNAIDNLDNESFRRFDCSIHNYGDIMYDSVLYYKDKLKDIEYKDFILCTIHREHNMDRLDEIIDFLNEIPNIIVVAHPRLIKQLKLMRIKVAFKIIDSVDYISMLSLLNSCNLVITDSGGLQKEAYFFGKRCLVLNETTSWIELIKNGHNLLINNLEKDHLLSKYKEILFYKTQFTDRYYGDGNTGKLITKEIQRYYDRNISSTSGI